MSRRVARNVAFALPADITSFVGRRRELAEAKDLLSQTRLLTLIGPGGVGKTRLALKLASDVRRSFVDGVCLVELAELKSAALLPHSVAGALGLGDASAPLSVDMVAAHLAEKRMLLVLDNGEHLTEACAALVRALLTAAPELRVLVTSREALKVTGEHTLAVPPLGVPEDEKLATTGDLLHYDGVQLFVERAGARLPGFALTPENRQDVARICNRLDGIPLAIELAAERMRVLSAEQLSKRLSSRLGFLTGGDRSGPARQQTLRASIDWSFDLCSEAEKLLWARLSVFRGGFELDAVEGVCADSDLPEENILDLLSALLDKSVLVREERGNRVRYRMLETIREFGHDRLDVIDELPVLRRRHRDWFERMVLDAYLEWVGPHQLDWLIRLRAEHSNIRAAMEFSLSDHAESQPALRIAAALTFYWVIRGLLSEGRHWLDEALSRDPAATVDRGRALWVNAYLSMMQGDVAAHERNLAAARKLLSGTGQTVDHPYLTFVAGHAIALGKKPVDAVPPLEEALAEFRAQADRTGEFLTCVVLGPAAWLGRDHTYVRAILRECVDRTAHRGEKWFQSYARAFEALVIWSQGDAPEAINQLRAALRMVEPLDDRLAIALNFEFLAWVHTGAGDWERGSTMLGAADAVWRSTGTSLDAIYGFARYRSECLDALRARTSTRALNDRLARGSALVGEHAVAYALGDEKLSPEPVAREVFAPLTPREWQVARTVAEGLTNRQIATRLAMAQRTAEGHVDHIMTKLAFSSRVQIAGWVNERHQRGAPTSAPSSR